MIATKMLLSVTALHDDHVLIRCVTIHDENRCLCQIMRMDYIA